MENSLCIDSDLNFTFSLNTDKIPDCKPSPSNPAACYMVIEKGPFSVDMCDSVQGYPPRLTEPGAGQEIWSVIAPYLPFWVGLTTTVDT